MQKQTELPHDPWSLFEMEITIFGVYIGDPIIVWNVQPFQDEPVKPRGSIYTTNGELGPKYHTTDGIMGPNSPMVVYVDPLGNPP